MCRACGLVEKLRWRAGPVGARQPPSSARVILRGAYLDQFPRRGLEFRDMTDWNSAAAAVYGTGVRHACGRGLSLHCYGRCIALTGLCIAMGFELLHGL